MEIDSEQDKGELLAEKRGTFGHLISYVDDWNRELSQLWCNIILLFLRCDKDWMIWYF